MTFVVAVIMQLAAVLRWDKQTFNSVKSDFLFNPLTFVWGLDRALDTIVKIVVASSSELLPIQSGAREKWKTEGQKLEWSFENNFPGSRRTMFLLFLNIIRM